MRPRSQEPIAPHSSVNLAAITQMTIYGHTGPCCPVTCPDCGDVRWVAIRTLRNQTKKENYTGACRKCWLSRPKKIFFTKRNPTGRRISSNGYVQLQLNAIDRADIPMFEAMANGRKSGARGFVAEHRWVMAKYLGRPLTEFELVDHMNGDKTDNRIENLRIYIRGKQMPGSHNGYGTYYHEWQDALRYIKQLEARLQGTGAQNA